MADALVGAPRVGLEVTPSSLGPYGPALARLLPDWSRGDAAASVESGLDPGLVLGEAVARFLGLVGRGRPCLLLVEDLHSADPDSWAVFVHVAVAVPPLPVLVVATLREDDPAAGTSSAVLSRLPAVTTVQLGLLPPGDIHRVHNAGRSTAISPRLGADLSLGGSSIPVPTLPHPCGTARKAVPRSWAPRKPTGLVRALACVS